MAAMAAESREADERKPALRTRQQKPGEENDGDDGDEETRRRHLFERFMASCGPGCPYLFEGPKVFTNPCVLYTMRVSIKKAQAFWSHRSSRRFFPERRGCFPIPLCRAAGPDGLVVDQPGAPGEPCRIGIVSVNYQEERYRLLELSREKGVIHKDGSLAAWREVAVIRGMAEGRGSGITVTSHVKHLVVRLHEFLFILSGSSATVDLRFSEKWFRIPAGWTEERLFAEDGFLIVDLGSSVENLVKKLCDLREHEEREMERRSSETEEERDMSVNNLGCDKTTPLKQNLVPRFAKASKKEEGFYVKGSCS